MDCGSLASAFGCRLAEFLKFYNTVLKIYEPFLIF